MSTLPRIYVIHRSEDKHRETLINEGYAKAGLNFDFIEAINGHGELDELKPYRNMLGKHFWGNDEIKPGAFACFLSHQMLWEKIAKGREPYAIITEDDSLPKHNFESLWPEFESALEDCDLLFINNRMSHWATRRFENVNTAIKSALSDKDHPIYSLPYRAPGGDAYLLTKQGAKKLLSQSKKDRVICGVDWYILAAAWNSNTASNTRNIPELNRICTYLGTRKAIIKGKISRLPLYELVHGEKSTLQHKTKVSIKALKSQLE